ncbi:hypothetical protein O3G_MSEX003813 [Manduca sexta]|uniref:Uncharacterized protein n=3 Tax=Manduca sexta TaxID=7130 RepID=A0A921YSW0_MANSE|nr:hypothetical protein O3G_MSEX003813 [Manduca sexta]
MYRQCCIFPPFFTRDIAKNCGALLTMNFIQGNITGFTRRTISRCKHWRCVLSKYDMLTPTGRLDDEKYYIHLDKWVELNPSFANAMLNAKVNCKLSFRHVMPLDPCEFYNFHGCIRNYIDLNCPAYVNTPQCAEVKEFHAECREFFYKK